MSKVEPDSRKKERHKSIRWVSIIFVVTILISGVISYISEEIMSTSGIIIAFCILFAIVCLGIIFDIIGVAVTSADEKPFHSMAARKVPGAIEAIRLLRNAERVSSICNDVVGDICGVVSGSASATIAAQILSHFEFSFPNVVILIMSAFVSGLTVGGKAVGKTFAINSSTEILHTVGKMIRFINHFPSVFRKKKK